MNSKLKQMIASILCICLFACIFSMIPVQKNRAESASLNIQSITLLKGQYACVVLKGGDSSLAIQWKALGKKIKIIKTGDYKKGEGYCYFKAAGTGNSILKCTTGKQTLKCKIKVKASASFIGDYADASKEIHLSVWKCGKNYKAFYSQLRLCSIDDLQGTVKNGILTLKGTDPSGKPLVMTVSKKGKKRVLKIKETTWEYFDQGSKTTLKKCSGKEGYTKNVGWEGIDREMTSEELLDLFISGSIDAVSTDMVSKLNIADFNIGSDKPDSYSIGEKVDLDNDGEKELIIRGAYGGIYLDARDNKVYAFAVGIDDNNILSYTYYNGEIWILYSNVINEEEEYYPSYLQTESI